MATTSSTTSKLSQRTVSTTAFLGTSSVAFMRAVTISFTVAETKPNTRLWAFFDGRSVDQWVNAGVPVVTDSNGYAAGTFQVPPMTFNTGDREFKLQDSKVFVPGKIPGSTVSFAAATFKTSAVKNTFQQTLETITTNTINTQFNIIDNPPPPPPPPVRTGGGGGGGGGGRGDPLAQSFFTNGVAGGCFITSIQVYFNSKSDNIPVTLEVRELENGYPSERLVSEYSTVTMNPDKIGLVTLDDLKRDVVGGGTVIKPASAMVFGHSYRIQTLGNTDFRQFGASSNTVGEFFKSTGPGTGTGTVESWMIGTFFEFPVPVYLPENRDFCFVLLSNSNDYHVYTSKLGEKSLETGKIIFEQPYIGSLFKSENNVTWSVDQTEDMKFKIHKAVFSTGEKTLNFEAKAVPTYIYGSQFSATEGSSSIRITCKHQHGLYVNDKIQLLAQANATFRGISAAALTGDFTVTAVHSLFEFSINLTTVANSTGTLANPGIVNSIVVDAGGSGYTSALAITLSAPPAGGVTATATATVVNGAVVKITITNPGSGYTNGAPTYSLSQFSTNPAKLAVISETIFRITTNNIANVYKPIVAIGIPPETSMSTFLTGTNYGYSAGTRGSIKLNDFKSTTYPQMLVNAPNRVARMGSTVPTNLQVVMGTTNPNTSPMLSLGELPRMQTLTYNINNPAEIQNPLDPLSELHPTGGNASSKYITKQFTVAKGVGVRMYVNAACLYECSFDVYFRSSRAGFVKSHKELPWVKMYCDVARNLSKREDEFIDYQFYLLNLEQFDVYDIKIVMKSSNTSVVPRIANYRAIILAE